MKNVLCLLILFLVLGGCKQNESSMPRQSVETERNVSLQDAPAVQFAGEKEEVTYNQKKDTGLQPLLFDPGEIPGRLLEYRIDLTYRSNDLAGARQILYDTAKKRGFLLQSYVSSESSVITTTMSVRIEEMHETLNDLSQIGSLESENIGVQDYTESEFIRSVRARREVLRLQRRSQALTGSAAAQNWSQREEALSSSENAADEATIEKWRITNRVERATIVISVHGPDTPDPVIIPSYRNALVGSLNLLLQCLYILVYATPILIPIAILIWKRKFLFGRIRREKNQA